MAENSKSENGKSPIVEALMDISEIMGNGTDFVYIMMAAKKWEKEAAEGNESSRKLVTMMTDFERLVKFIKKNARAWLWAWVVYNYWYERRIH